MTLMWRHRNRPGVPDSAITPAPDPFDGETQGGSEQRETPAKSWTKEKLVEWGKTQGYEFNEESTKAELVEFFTTTEPEQSKTPDEGDESGKTPEEDGNGDNQA